MGYRTEWLVPDRVLELSLYGSITEHDLKSMNASIEKHFDTKPLHIVFNGSEIEFPYLNLERAAQLLPALRDKRMGWFILCGKMSPVVHFLTTSFATKIKLSIATAQNPHDAVDVLVELDHTLAADLIKGIA